MAMNRSPPPPPPAPPRAAQCRERVAAIMGALPEARAVTRGSHLSLEVRGKRFGWYLEDHHEDGRLAIHCKASERMRRRLRASLEEAVHKPAYVGQHAWVGLWLDVPGLDWTGVEDALREAYALTAPKRLAAAPRRQKRPR